MSCTNESQCERYVPHRGGVPFGNPQLARTAANCATSATLVRQVLQLHNTGNRRSDGDINAIYPLCDVNREGMYKFQGPNPSGPQRNCVLFCSGDQPRAHFLIRIAGLSPTSMTDADVSGSPSGGTSTALNIPLSSAHLRSLFCNCSILLCNHV